MKIKKINYAPTPTRVAPSNKGLFRGIVHSTLASLVLLITLCKVAGAVAETKSESEPGEAKEKSSPVLGDPNYKHDLKYSPIYANMDGSSFALHYCLPGFVPQELGDCHRGSIPGHDPQGVQVVYTYYLRGRDAEHAQMEGGGTYEFPFPFNVDLNGRTPYETRYKEALNRARLNTSKVIKHQGNLQGKYEGLDFYEVPGQLGGWWVPEKLDEYRTKLGNPPIFVCGKNSCFLNLDQGNGWVVSARFNAAALKDWRTFYMQLNYSIKIIMEP